MRYLLRPGRRSLTLVAALAVGTTLVAACSSGGGGTTSSSSTPATSGAASSSMAASSPTSSAAATSSAGSSSGSAPASSAMSSGAAGSAPAMPNLSGTSFTILGQWTGTEGAAWQSVLNAFDKATGATAKYTPAAGGGMATVLGAKVNGGTPPDIAIVSLPGSIDQYGAAGKLQPVDATAQAATAANYAGEWAKLATVNGKLYGVPVDAADKSTVWYNATLFKDAGISSPPATWQDFLKDGQTLADSGVPTPISVGGGDGWTLTDWFENIYIRSAGLAKYDQLTCHKIPWTDPSVTTALTTLKQVLGNKALTGDPATAVKTSFPSSVDNVFKAKPTSAIVYEASFVATTISSDKDPAVVGKTALFFPFPSVNGSKPVMEASGDFAIAFTKNKAVQPFLAFLASPEAAKLLVSFKGSGFLSANKNLSASAYPDPVSADLGKQIVSVGSNFRFDMSDQAPAAFGGTPNKGEWGDLQDFLRNGNVQATQQQLEKDAAASTGWC